MIKTFKETIDPSQAAWLSLLPGLEDKVVCIIGDDTYNLVEILKRCGCHHVECIGLEPLVISDLRIGLYDISVILPDRLSSIKALAKILIRSLRPDGILLIGTSNTLSVKMVDMKLSRSLEKVGFNSIEPFICTPSFNNPLDIFPVGKNDDFNKIVFRQFRDKCFLNRNIKSLVKDAIKYLLFITRGWINPSFGMLLICRKRKTGYWDFQELLETKCLGRRAELHKRRFLITWHSKHFVGKHVGLAYQIQNKKEPLEIVIKKSNFSYHRAGALNEEHTHLKTFCEHEAFFNETGIAIPKPVCKKESKGLNILTVETAVMGTPLKKLGLNKQVNFKQYQTIVDGLINCQINFQVYFSKVLDKNCRTVPDICFENSAGFECDLYEDISRISDYQRFAQHGDYTDVNLFYQFDTKRYGIIDWEWFSRGLPPLFDLFHFFLSIGFTRQDSSYQNELTSFADTFFSKNWFSDYIEKKVMEYIDRFKLEIDSVYPFFMDFLLFLHNKYYLFYNFPFYLNLHRKMIVHAVNNKETFFMNQVTAG
ncbi:MAG: hypothetical protein HN417_01480 [Desulfobacula sp.]|jgi:hypothetical protein|nr:hypothetical protein [Desulfobacula sp.]MBT7260059.1 hypothetical protein [Desulfobacula sp.]